MTITVENVENIENNITSTINNDGTIVSTTTDIGQNIENVNELYQSIIEEVTDAEDNTVKVPTQNTDLKTRRCCTCSSGECDGTGYLQSCYNNLKSCKTSTRSSCTAQMTSQVAFQLECIKRIYQCIAKIVSGYMQYILIFLLNKLMETIAQQTCVASKALDAAICAQRESNIIAQLASDVSILSTTYATDDMKHPTIKTMVANVGHCLTTLSESYVNLTNTISNMIHCTGSILDAQAMITYDDMNCIADLCMLARQLTECKMCISCHQKCIKDCIKTMKSAMTKLDSLYTAKLSSKQKEITWKKNFDKQVTLNNWKSYNEPTDSIKNSIYTVNSKNRTPNTPTVS